MLRGCYIRGRPRATLSAGFCRQSFGFGFRRMRVAFQVADHSGPSRKEERGQGRQLAAILFRSVMIRARENFIRRYSLTGLNRSRYFALAGRNCFSVFLDFEQFRTIKVGDDVAEQADFSRKNGESAKGGSPSVNRDGGHNIREND
jgi:hypothetical protein